MVEIDYIIQQCRQYNKLAQRLLYEMYAPKMMGLCSRYVSDNEVIKDIVQEGFIKVFSNIRQFKGDGSFEGWIKRVFINTAITYIRKNKKIPDHINIEEIEEACFQDTDMHYSNDNTASDKISSSNDLINSEHILLADFSEVELLNALQKIPEKYRIVFNLSCIENMKHEEIAEILDVDITTSRTRLLRARNLLKKELFVMCFEKQKKMHV